MSDWLNLIWPLCFVLVLLGLLRKVEAEVKPVVASVVNGLAEGARKNAVPYALAFGYGVSASMMAFNEVFSTLGHEEWAAMTWHQYFSMWARVLNPFIIAVLAYMKQPNFSSQAGPSGGTNPPIPSR